MDPSTVGQEGQGAPLEPCVASTSDGECIIAPQVQSALPAWPWLVERLVHHTQTNHKRQDEGFPNTVWPYSGPQWGVWGMPWGVITSPPQPVSYDSVAG